MIFLLKYDRRAGKVRYKKIFPATERPKAHRERLALELESRKSAMLCEVVLLEAADEAALLRTHQRYFQSTEELVESMVQP
ncbi:MAG TPA: hypothetical protein VGH22_21235 [Candidatus Binatia bacterium]|jgi:hypothetical protein